MTFAGSGGPPPKMAREKGLSTGGGQKPFGFRFYEKLANGKNKTIQMISVDKGEQDCPILILDEAKPGGEEWQPSVYIHERFRYNGTWGNYAVVPKTPEGNLVDLALQEPFKMMPWSKPEDEARVGMPVPKRPKWRWVCTAIKLKPYTVMNGKNKGKVLPYTRGLLFFSEDGFKEILTYRKAFKGLRGRVFNVSRSNGQFASRIGDKWNPSDDEVWTDEKMLEHFADAAREYGLAVEDYCRPFDYEKILRLPNEKELADMAKWIAGERGIDLGADLSKASKVEGSSGSTPATTDPVADEENEEDVPF